MKNTATYLIVLITGGYLFLLHYPIQSGSVTLPPLGSFLNPFTGFWQNAEPTRALPSLESHMLGLNEEVEVIFDDRAVPHIFARNSEDLAYVQGYLHAKDRLFQMDLGARQAHGRLAEVFGARVLEIDLRNRRMGMSTNAQKYANEWRKCPDLPLLEAYIDGANFFIGNLKKKDYPIEYKLFNYEPEPWSIEKAAGIMMSMNLVLCGRNEDLEHTNSLAMLGADEYNHLFPEWNPKQSPIIPSDHKWNFKSDRDTVRPDGTKMKMLWEQPAAEGIGSNNWAIHGSRTATGYPLLCNDPHLQLTLPSIWYEIQLATSQQNAYGVSFPGIPQIIIGFNQNIAWGQTNVGMDVSDLYQIIWTDEKREVYEFEGSQKKADIKIEKVLVKGAETAVDTVRYTHWGPVMEEEGLHLALHWLPSVDARGCQMSTFTELNSGKDYEDYLEALRHFNSPPQNYVFASVQGDIAMKVQGHLPIKNVNQGKFVLDGSKQANAWQGYIDHLQSPMIKNPARGYVSSANQHSTDPSYPYFYHGYFEDYRSRSLNHKLEELSKASVPDMKALQLSSFSQHAADLCPLLLRMIDTLSLSVSEKLLYRYLNAWDYCFDSSSTVAIGFDLWSDAFYDLTWDEFEDSVHAMKTPENWRTIQLLEEEPSSKYFDIEETDKQETAEDLVQMAFSQTAEKFDSILGEGMTWADYRTLQIPHLSRLPALSVNQVRTGGTSSALNAVSSRNAPSWRMIVQLGPKVKAWGVFPGGASGNPGSPYYTTGIDTWANGSYFTLHFMTSASDLSDDSSLSKHSISP